MVRASRDHAKDQEVSRKTGHIGSDGSTPFDRLSRYGAVPGQLGENIVYGNYKEPVEHILSMLIDDGVKSRVHRQNLFNDSFRYMS